MKKYDVENDEKNILEDFEAGEFESVENLNEEMKSAKQAANNFLKRNSQIQG